MGTGTPGNNGLVNYGFSFSVVAINNARGIVVTTTLTGNAAILNGYTLRPRIISLTGVLITVNTGVDNVNASVVAVRNIRHLRNYRCSIIPSHVRANSCLTNTLVAHNSILAGGASTLLLAPILRGFRSVNTIVADNSS